MKKNLLLCLSASVFLLAIPSCKKDKEPDNPNKVNYAISTTGGIFPNQTTYLFGTNQFPAGTVSNANAAELSSSGIMYKYGTNIYLTTFGAPATLRKYSFDTTGKPQQIANFSIAGLKLLVQWSL